MQRHIFTKKILAWVLLLVAWQCNAADTTFKDMTQDELVKAVMNDQYGNTYDEELKCWLYKSQKGHRYCIVPAKSEVVELKDSKRIYIIVTSLPPFREPLKSSPKVDRPVPELVGALLIEKSNEDTQWHYKATSKELNIFRSVCCLHKAELLKISNANDYVWLFTEWETIKGVPEDTYVMLYPKDRDFINISKLYERNDRIYKNKIEILGSDSDCEFFPIKLTKIIDYYGNVDMEEMFSTKYDENNPHALDRGTVISTKTIHFNKEKFLYTE